MLCHPCSLRSCPTGASRRYRAEHCPHWRVRSLLLAANSACRGPGFRRSVSPSGMSQPHSSGTRLVLPSASQLTDHQTGNTQALHALPHGFEELFRRGKSQIEGGSLQNLNKLTIINLRFVPPSKASRISLDQLRQELSSRKRSLIEWPFFVVLTCLPLSLPTTKPATRKPSTHYRMDSRSFLGGENHKSKVGACKI